MKNAIVMVDDNEEMRNVFVELFKNTDTEVICFASVLEAKTHLNSPANAAEVKAIISDLIMGQTDGLDFLSYVKAQSTLRNIDFYLLTGVTISDFEPLLKSSVLKGVIEKPFDTNRLVSLFTDNRPRA